jgi:NAD(P)-dependent dehydrogenase (short-subunit alcohol dehydrogenase family)
VSRFEGRTAVVTGGGGQIGGATARRLASEGASVLVVDRDEEGVAATVAGIEDAGGTASGCVADVADEVQIVRHAARGADLGGGRIDAFFNNAGVEGPVAPIEEYPVEEWDRLFAVNARGVFLGLKHVLPHMGEGSAVVNTASIAGVTGAPGIVGYIAAKHAVVGITRTAALETGERGIRVNAVCPGPISGRMMASLEEGWGGPAVQEALLRSIPLRRYGTVEDVAALVAFLLAAEAAHCHGATFTVDGGQTAS